VALAPEIAVSRWFNTSEPLTLSGLRGRPVLLHAFQMLCPGCVAHGTPQTQRAFDIFKHSDLQVIGLHTVFEHHAAMTPVSLEAFIHEYKLTFPIGVDETAEGTPIPVTMGRYGMQGTPTRYSDRTRWPRCASRIRAVRRHGPWRDHCGRACRNARVIPAGLGEAGGSGSLIRSRHRQATANSQESPDQASLQF